VGVTYQTVCPLCQKPVIRVSDRRWVPFGMRRKSYQSHIRRTHGQLGDREVSTLSDRMLLTERVSP
jgi:hypothetical protein